jgi:hypothetical protein
MLPALSARCDALAAASLNSSSPAFITRVWPTRAVKQFLEWCDERQFKLAVIEAITVATYIERLGTRASKLTIKQHLAAIRPLVRLSDHRRHFWEVNPAASVRGPRYMVKRGNPGAVIRGGTQACSI